MATKNRKVKNGMRPLAIVTGASSGIGFHLAKQCAENGFDLLIAADDPAIHKAAQDLRDIDVGGGSRNRSGHDNGRR
jgi:NAD(P)-dependent dehydrogenase (short-subunit alcohol dehydrogenase family)